MEFTQTGSGMYKWIKENEQKDVIIDDFGAESVGNFYGNKIDLGQVIIQRYNSFKEYKSITIITTNNSLSEIAERYGVRVGELLKEMIFPVIILINPFQRVAGSNLRRYLFRFQIPEIIGHHKSCQKGPWTSSLE